MGGLTLGVFGGTFDPVHLGHLLVAEEAREQLGLERLLLLPARDPWLRGREATPAHHRLAMLRLAVADYPAFEVCTLEMERSGPSYTTDTLEELHHLHGPDVQVFFLIGWDALRELPRWHEPARVLSLCTLVALTRPAADEPWAELETALPGAGAHIQRLEVPLIEISGTTVRQRVAQGRSIRYWVPEPVRQYILANGLYRPSV